MNDLANEETPNFAAAGLALRDLAETIEAQAKVCTAQAAALRHVATALDGLGQGLLNAGLIDSTGIEVIRVGPMVIDAAQGLFSAGERSEHVNGNMVKFLVYLAERQGKYVMHSRVATDLWPRSDRGRAQASFRQALVGLRKLFDGMDCREYLDDMNADKLKLSDTPVAGTRRFARQK